jgi:hypothetical protein
VQFRLVHAAATTYEETGDPDLDLRRLRARGDGHFDEAHQLRGAHGADLVALIVDRMSQSR